MQDHSTPEQIENRRRISRESKQRERERDREAYNAYMREYRAKNSEKCAKIDRKRRTGESAAAFRARRRVHYEANIERMRADQRDHYRSHPELLDGILASNRTRKARRAGAVGRHTAEEIAQIWDRQQHRCAVPDCQWPISVRGKNKFHVDHIVPLTREDSTNWPENLQILCSYHNIQKRATKTILSGRSPLSVCCS